MQTRMSGCPRLFFYAYQFFILRSFQAGEYHMEPLLLFEHPLLCFFLLFDFAISFIMVDLFVSFLILIIITFFYIFAFTAFIKHWVPPHL
jgi:hypothetical protein